MLTIGELAARTGVQPGTLRMWESRHGFPRAERLPSGHRRYPAAEVQRVLEVVRHRDAGLSLAAAIARATQDGDAPAVPSIFAGLRERRPELTPYPVPKRLLVPISHALEDECSARGGGAFLIGSFQRERFCGQAEPRWRSFARTAELCIAMGDFPKLNDGTSGPIEVPIDRVFEMLWSVEPDAVREAARIGTELATADWPELRERVPDWLSEPPEADDNAVQRATALTNRMLAYVTAAN